MLRLGRSTAALCLLAGGLAIKHWDLWRRGKVIHFFTPLFGAIGFDMALDSQKEPAYPAKLRVLGLALELSSELSTQTPMQI